MTKIRKPVKKRTEKQMKENAILSGFDVKCHKASDSDTNFVFTPTGIKDLDIGWGGGMLPGINQLWGAKEAGKSTKALQIAAYVYKNFNMRVCYLDFERKMTSEYMQAMGLEDMSYHTLVKPKKSLDGIRAIVSLVDSGIYDLFIVDSIGAIDAEGDTDTTDKKGRDKIGSHKVGSRAKICGAFVANVVSKCEDKNINILCINQVRANIVTDKFLAKYAATEKYPGGHAYNHSIMNSVCIRAGKSIVEDKKVVGKVIKAKIDLNKTSTPYSQFEYPLMFGQTEEEVERDLFDLACEADIITSKTKGWYVYDGNKYRKKELKEIIESDEEFQQELKESLGIA